MRPVTLLLAAAFGLTLADPASAAPAVRSLAPVADAHVSASAPGRNYGSQPTLRIASPSDGRAYVRFRVPDLRGVVRSATLRMYSRLGSRSGVRVRFVRDDTWVERRITFRNAPAARARPAVSSGPLRRGAWTSVDVTALVRPRSLVTLELTATGRRAVAIASRERGRRGPRLVVASDPVLVAAGDIAACDSAGDEATAALVHRISATVATLGDNAYPAGTPEEFTECYAPSWGRARKRTRPAPGNHDYLTEGARGYFGYFGAAAGHPARGYYSYDLGRWHVVVLNSNCAQVGGCHAGSPQERWLRSDLASHAGRCSLAYWHHARFSSGPHGGDPMVEPFWQALADHGAELVLSGHDHIYERFAPQAPGGVLDRESGIRQFVVGTGGRSHYAIAAPAANSEVRNDTAFGVLRLVLRPASYAWKFVPERGRAFTDSGSTRCH